MSEAVALSLLYIELASCGLFILFYSFYCFFFFFYGFFFMALLFINTIVPCSTAARCSSSQLNFLVMKTKVFVIVIHKQ